MPNPHSGVNRLILSRTGGKDINAYNKAVLGNATAKAETKVKLSKKKKK